MALPRAAGPLFSSTTSVFLKFTASSSASHRCLQCLRTFSSYKSLDHSSKRQLQTVSAHHPSTLNPEPLPRNWAVPDVSRVSGAPEVTSSIAPRLMPEQREASTQQDRPSISVSEGEAQRSQPTPSPKPLRPRRYNFGPRKATIKLSPSAVSHLRDLLDQPEPKLIRIGTKAKGCSGLAYHLEYVDKPSKLDEQVEQDGVKVLIDNKALLNIIGSEMDWLEDKLNQRFVFKNPNITEQCGCGESFSVS
ncbi:uncharacterized protein BDR25DRAFT_241312 [Lindgomyces ingoldianus]|uniref:Uncharacterized protein n=1 Tax=Lindgomyces ingoldianus TaxID=673940 RepID=A0ACB6QDG3_9PLEO|nr:uncharacterized protein BDR25DRAFT_241312 [Lindgomyces ingoldianus]KAF2464971.1 hypothetical protein BDR25DRAFT_241312 [Lindgomyces ingoldianus]